MIIGIDFDGTCVTHEFPKIGQDIGAIPVLQALVNQGHDLILFTMRSDTEKIDEQIPLSPHSYLADAVEWFSKNNIDLFGIQTHPTQHRWTTSPKANCQLFIDDAGLGCPVKFDTTLSARHFVDWEKVKRILIRDGVLNDF